ncbi:MAG: hypothetical protein WBB69_07220 [Anaerolineales bacterium]
MGPLDLLLAPGLIIKPGASFIMKAMLFIPRALDDIIPKHF